MRTWLLNQLGYLGPRRHHWYPALTASALGGSTTAQRQSFPGFGHHVDAGPQRPNPGALQLPVRPLAALPRRLCGVQPHAGGRLHLGCPGGWCCLVVGKLLWLLSAKSGWFSSCARIGQVWRFAGWKAVVLLDAGWCYWSCFRMLFVGILRVDHGHDGNDQSWIWCERLKVNISDNDD